MQDANTSKVAPRVPPPAVHGGILPDAVTARGVTLGVRNVILAYALRNSWLDRRDLEQEAALAALTADPGWEPRVVALALSRFVAEQRVPVSLPKSKGASWCAAAIATRVELDDDMPELAETPEERIDRERALARIRAIMAEQTEAARLVLLAEENRAAVAARLRVSVCEVYQATRQAMRALRAAFAMEAA